MSISSARYDTDATPAGLAAEAALSRHTDFMEALVAACAIMAHADGEMAGAERRRLLRLVRENAALAVFSRQDIVDEIAVHEANYGLDPEVAILIAREKLMQIAGRDRLGHRVVNACRDIIAADGIAHPSEYRALAEIRAMLGLGGPSAPAPDRASESRRPARY